MLAGTVGSFLGAQATNRNARTQQNILNQTGADAQNKVGLPFFGLDDFNDYKLLTAVQGNSTPDMVSVRVDNGWKWVKRADLEGAKQRFESTHPSMLQSLKDSAGPYMQGLESNQDQEHNTTQMLDRLGTQNEQAGQDLTRQETARIQRDSQRGLTNLNRQTSTQLGLMGINSLAANQTAANTRLAGQQAGDQILNTQMAGLDRFQRARQQRIGVLTGRTALEGELGRNIVGQRRSLALEGPQATMSLVGSGAFRPAGVAGGGGQSPLGSALGSIGTGLTALGGSMLTGPSGGQGQAPQYGQPGGGQYFGMQPASFGPYR